MEAWPARLLSYNLHHEGIGWAPDEDILAYLIKNPVGEVVDQP